MVTCNGIVIVVVVIVIIIIIISMMIIIIINSSSDGSRSSSSSSSSSSSKRILYRSRGLKTKLKLEQMLEQLHFILGGWVFEGTQDSDRIVALKKKKKNIYFHSRQQYKQDNCIVSSIISSLHCLTAEG